MSAESKRRAVQRLQEEDDAATLAVMSTRDGRRMISRILGSTGYGRSCFTGNSQTYFNEGMAHIGELLVSNLKRVCLDKFRLMEDENTRRPSTTQEESDVD